MDDFVGFLFFLAVFVIGPIMQARKKSQQQLPPPPRRHPTLPTDMRTGLPAPTEPERSRTEENAAGMVPDELWAVLTGQPMPSRPRPPVPAPAPFPVQRAPVPRPPQPVFDESDHEEEEQTAVVEARSLEGAGYEARGREEAVSLEREPNRVQPYVVSMEEPPQAAAARHAAFHERARQAPAAARPKGPVVLDLSHTELRRAFVLQTVLGPPKALE